MELNFKTLIELLDYFSDNQTCLDYLEGHRWDGEVSCPHCGSAKVWRTDRGFKCADKDCHKKFSVISGTIFENTKIALRTWFAAFYLISTHKKGISSLQLSRDLGITQKTAWFLLHRVRAVLKENNPEMLDGTIEADETYVGGKNRNRHENKKVPNSQGRASIDKTPVVGLLAREGKVVTFEVGNTDSQTIHEVVKKKVKKGTTLVTDAYRSYNGLGDLYKHVVVKHA